jgi:hypothetical protein
MTRNEALTLRGKLVALKRESTQLTGALVMLGRQFAKTDDDILSTINAAAGDAADLSNKLELAIEQVQAII